MTQDHLGGDIKGGDRATYLPDLWDWLVDDLGVSRVIDIGCGDGVAIEHFHARGCDALGVEGIPQTNLNIIRHDFATGPYVPECRFDLAWCCEFVEHVEEQFSENFLETFCAADIVLMTHASPGQPGYHHVNCQPAPYWLRRMREIGFTLDAGLTIATRQQSLKNDFIWIDRDTGEVHVNHYLRSGLAFRRAS